MGFFSANQIHNDHDGCLSILEEVVSLRLHSLKLVIRHRQQEFRVLSGFGQQMTLSYS